MYKETSDTGTVALNTTVKLAKYVEEHMIPVQYFKTVQLEEYVQEH